MKALLFAVGLVSFGTGQTFAADIPIKAPQKPVIAYDWTGIYSSIGVGWSFDRTLWRLPNPIPGTLLPSTLNTNGPAFGSFMGIQKQFNWLVVGVEGGAVVDRNIFGSVTSGNNLCTATAGQMCQSRIRTPIWLAGGKLGYA
jgi:hypothetical protein